MFSESQNPDSESLHNIAEKAPGSHALTSLRSTGPSLNPGPSVTSIPPQLLPCPGVSCLSQLLGCISGDPMIPTPLLCSPCSSINVTLGAHNIKQQERTQQVIGVKRAIRHPDYNPENFSNDIMLLQARKTPHWPCPPGITSQISQDLLPLSSFPSWPPDQSQGR